MQYVHLGRTGVEVSPYCLGTMIFGSWGIDEQASVNVIHRALNAGINMIDTADIYGSGSSEEIIGKAIAGKRNELVLATKFKLRTQQGPNGAGASRYRIIRQVEESLRRLKTDRIDLYQIHRPDPNIPIDETLRALDDLVRQGKVLYIGCSNFDAWRIMESLWVSDKMNLERFVSHQPSYSLLDRYAEMEVLPASEKYGLATLVYSPLAGGWLSGKYSKNGIMPEDSRGKKNNWNIDDPVNQEKLDKVGQLAALAKEKNITLSQLALAWLLHRSKSIIPIIGVRTTEQLDDNLKALEVKLTTEDMQRVDQIVPSPFKDFSK